MTEGIKLWHRILTNSEKINLDVDWIHYVEESWVHVINEKRSSFSNLAYIDPFTQKMDSSPSKQPSLAIKEQKENFFLSLILFLAYLNEKVIYDLQSFSKAPFLPLLLKAYFSLFQTLILSATTVIFEFRSVCIQIISLGLNMIKCQENPTSDFSNTVRAMLMDCLAGLFSVPDRFYYSDKKRYQLECELKERCSLLLWDDFTRLNEHIKCKVVAFSDGVARDPLLLHEDPTIQLCEKVGSLKIKGSDSIKLQKTPSKSLNSFIHIKF